MAIHPKQGVGEGPEISAVQPWRRALGLENSLCSVLCCGVDVATAITFLQPLGVKKYPIHKKAEFRKGHPSSTLMVYVMPGYNFKVLRRENCLSSRFWALPFLKHAGPQSPFFLLFSQWRQQGEFRDQRWSASPGNSTQRNAFREQRAGKISAFSPAQPQRHWLGNATFLSCMESAIAHMRCKHVDEEGVLLAGTCCPHRWKSALSKRSLGIRVAFTAFKPPVNGNP